jgi:hypothetical protein
MKVVPLRLQPGAGPAAPGRCDSGHGDPRRAGDRQPLARWHPPAHGHCQQQRRRDRRPPLRRLAGAHHRGAGDRPAAGVALLAPMRRPRSRKRPSFSSVSGFTVISWGQRRGASGWRKGGGGCHLGDGLGRHNLLPGAPASQERGVVQSSMKPWASGPAAM